MKRRSDIVSRGLRARSCLGLSAGVFLISTSALAAGPTTSELEGLVTACRTPALGFDAAVDRLTAQGWTTAASAPQKQDLARHIATGVHHRPDAAWQGDAHQMADSIPSLLKSSSGMNENAEWSTQAAGFVKSGASGGFLVVTEDTIHDRSGQLKARGRTCWAVLTPSPALDALAAMAKPGRRGAKLPPTTQQADGVAYSVTGLIKSLPSTGLGFAPKATEFLQINMRH